MAFLTEIEQYLWSGIFFFSFFVICCGLLERRFSQRISLFVLLGFLSGETALQAVLFAAGMDTTLILTILPLTAYLPAILCVHILSKQRFFQTVAIWTIGLVLSFTLRFFCKLILAPITMNESLSYVARHLLLTGSLVLVAGGLLFVVFRFIRKPFRQYVLHSQVNWLPLCFPVIMIFLLFSYFGNSTTDVTVWILILLTALSVFVVLTLVFLTSASLTRARETEKATAVQMEIQSREYKNLCGKMERGRAYRHDMRHHLAVLKGLVKQGDTEQLSSYLEGLHDRLSDTEQEMFCSHPTINAVLSFFIGQAKEKGGKISVAVQLGKELSFEEMDLCVILANALENAIHACEEIPEPQNRYIELCVDGTDPQKLAISVLNPCRVPLAFDADGLPVVPEREGHGVGLKSIKSIVEKYHGMFHCECKEGKFHLKAVLFSPPKVSHKRRKPLAAKVVTTTLLSAFAFCFLVNSMPVMAQTLEKIPGIGLLTRVANFRSYDFGWGDTEFHATLPQIDTGQTQASSAPESEPPAEEGQPSSSAGQAGGEVPAGEETLEGAGTEKKDEPASSGSISWESGRPEPEAADPVPPESTPSEPEATDPVPPESTPSEPEATDPVPPESTPSEPEATDPVPPESTPSEPEPPDLSDGAADMNAQMEGYIEELREIFFWYVARKYEGYVGLDSTYTILRNDETFLSLRFETTLNAGGSGQFSRCFTLDKQTGQVLSLADLFVEDAAYIPVISEEILRQMTEQVEAGLADYFIPGGIWSEEECFQEIQADQNFYINDQNQLVIVFDEYEVAPGSAGMPEFVIPYEVLDGILQQPSLIGAQEGEGLV